MFLRTPTGSAAASILVWMMTTREPSICVPSGNIVVRQVAPEGDEAMYEIFNRLNSGGVNLTPQEIRRCMFDSKFYDLLYRTNTEDRWRDLVGARVPDVHMKDVEILLRGFAMLMQGHTYRPSMVKFLNGFSKQARSFDGDQLTHLQSLLSSFLNSCKTLPSDAFHSLQGRFSPMIFESVFVAACHEPYTKGQQVEGEINLDSLNALKSDPDFHSATQSQTTAAANVNKRLNRARRPYCVGLKPCRSLAKTRQATEWRSC